MKIYVAPIAGAGNRVDLSSNDLLQYWIDDDGTHAVGLYVESMGNPRKFSRIARHPGMTKPVIVVKSGEGTLQVAPGVAGRHTQLGQDAFDAMLRQAGVIERNATNSLTSRSWSPISRCLPGIGSPLSPTLRRCRR